MKIYFVTKNSNKVKEAKQILQGMEIEQIDLDIPEIQSKEVEAIAREKAKAAAELTGKAVFVEDVGFYIEALNGFPGALIVWVENSIGNEGILKLMQCVENRAVTARCAIAYCEPKKEPKVFVGEVKGRVAERERGTEGFGFDPIFIPEGFEQTYAEMGVQRKNKISHRRKALEKFKEHLAKS